MEEKMVRNTEMQTKRTCQKDLLIGQVGPREQECGGGVGRGGGLGTPSPALKG